MSYFDGNKAYWERGYNAPNVDHHMFRFFGRILRHDFPELTQNGGKLVDFGCGQGAAVNYFIGRGFDARGVDISEKDVEVARTRYPDIANRFDIVDPDPSNVPHYGFDSEVDVVTAFQSLYYFNNRDFDLCLRKLYDSMKTGGVIFATMMGTRSEEFYANSQPAEDGLRVVNFDSGRLNVSNYYMFFVEDEEDLKQRFSLFKPLHIGYYAAKLRNDEGDGFHYTFCGVKE